MDEPSRGLVRLAHPRKSVDCIDAITVSSRQVRESHLSPLNLSERSEFEQSAVTLSGSVGLVANLSETVAATSPCG